MRVVRERNRESVERCLLREMTSLLRRRPMAVVGLDHVVASRSLLAALDAAIANGSIDVGEARVACAAEFVGFEPVRRGGIVHECLARCESLQPLYDAGRLWGPPASGEFEALAKHEAGLRQAGGVDLQLVEVGPKGQLGFVEPGDDDSVDRRFHRARLQPARRAALRQRFDPDEPPFDVVTAGGQSYYGAHRVLAVACGSAVATAVRDAVEGPIDPRCPLSLLRRNPDAYLYADAEAAAMLPPPDRATQA